jgi:putative DNA primase/helicase
MPNPKRNSRASVADEMPFRPTVRIEPGALHDMATEAEAALIAAQAPIFQRDGLVRPVSEEVAASGGHRTTIARLVPVNIATMVDHLSRAAKFEKWNARKTGYVPAHPPRDVAETLLSRVGEWSFRRLAGVITAPTLRPDGSLLSNPGYDLETRLLLLDPPPLPRMRATPTRTHALRALNYLDSLLEEFPFADDASRSVALSALISPIVRGAMPVAPLHAISSPTPGSGKSFLVDLASAIQCGDRAPVLSVAPDLAETEKRIVGALLDGQSIVTLDNVNGDLLCQAVERPVVSIRALGGSPLKKIESRATFFATGNNLKLVSDMARRTIVSTLDPKLERPELRKFGGDPFAAVIANRGTYIAAALTVVRAYVVAGYPGVLPPLASFEAWSNLVRSALVWLGRADPVATQEAARAEDPTLANLKTVLAAWHDAVGSESRTTKAIIAAATDRNEQYDFIHEDLHEALMAVAGDKRGEINSLTLGNFLRVNKGRVAAGMRIHSVANRSIKQPSWSVVSCGGSGG